VELPSALDPGTRTEENSIACDYKASRQLRTGEKTKTRPDHGRPARSYPGDLASEASMQWRDHLRARIRALVNQPTTNNAARLLYHQIRTGERKLRAENSSAVRVQGLALAFVLRDLYSRKRPPIFASEARVLARSGRAPFRAIVLVDDAGKLWAIVCSLPKKRTPRITLVILKRRPTTSAVLMRQSSSRISAACFVFFCMRTSTSV
jgi:hypothetical protein